MFDTGQVAILDSEGDYDQLALSWSQFKLPDMPSWNPNAGGGGGGGGGFPGIKQQLITFGIGSGSTLLSALAARISGGLVGPSPENLGIIFGNPYRLAGSGATIAAGGNVASAGATAGAAVGNIGDAIGQIVFEHPYLTVGALLGGILLFMPSPRRGR
jgi:hypothetical protein